MDVAVVGAGRVGTAMAVLLGRAGHRITAVFGGPNTAQRAARYLVGVPVLGAAEAAATGELIVIGVPDDVIENTVVSLAEAGAIRSGTWVAHLSGASGLDVLAAARAAGGRVLAIHPLMTVPDVENAILRIPGCTFAVTADDEEGAALGEQLGRDIGARPFRLADDDRALYHAAAVFASNYVVTSVALARDLLQAAGVPDPDAALSPLLAATIGNIERLGPEQALTGPAVRGDADTIQRNLEALRVAAPHAIRAYVELCRVALDLASRAGRLSTDGRASVEEVLARWT